MIVAYALEYENIAHLSKLLGRLVGPQNPGIIFQAGTLNLPEDRIAQSIQ